MQIYHEKMITSITRGFEELVLLINTDGYVYNNKARSVETQSNGI